MPRRLTQPGILCLLGACIACSAACQRRHQPTLEVIPKGTGNIYWQAVHAGAAQAGRDFHYRIVWDGPPNETEYARQTNIVEDAVDRGVDGIVLAPDHRDALVPAVQKALAQHVPVTIMDSGINLPPADYVSFVATDNTLGGRMAADRMGEILPGGGAIAIVGVAPGSVSTTEREQGFEAEIKARFPAIHIVDFRYGLTDAAKSRAVAEDMLSAHPGLRALFASNESSALGALLALRGRGLAGRVKLVGFDSDADLLLGLRQGDIDSLVVQDPYAIGYQGVQTMVEALAGKHPPQRISTPVRLVTRENLGDAAIQKLVAPSLLR